MHVVVVEDNVDLANLARIHLEQAGHEVVVLIGGRAAVDWAGWPGADAAVVDIHMPEVDGIQVLAFLASRYPHLTLVVLTADVVAAQRLEVFVVAKPWSANELLAAVERVL
jgi:DNA-binding response OmpR family regulator